MQNTHQEKRKREKEEKRRKKKKPKMNFFFLPFLTRNTKRKTPQHCKRLIWRWKYVGGINSVIYKKKKKKY